jgi:hypothetical protein
VILMFHTEHDTFDASAADLERIEPSLGSAPPRRRRQREGDALAVGSSSGRTYSLERHADGIVVRSCTEPAAAAAAPRRTPTARSGSPG